MKRRLTFKSFLTATFLLLSFNLYAQETTVTVNMDIPGTLSDKLGDNANNITNLTVAGDINYVDLAIMNKMPKLQLLNISNASIKSCKFNGIDYDANALPTEIFKDKTSLSTCILPNNVTYIYGNAFSGCSGLASITIPNSVTTIGFNAFMDCTGLTSVIIGNSVTYIDVHAFMNCTGLKSIIIPNSVTSIINLAFYNCTGLTSVTIGDSVTSIGYLVFSGCTELKEIHSKNASPPKTDTNVFDRIDKIKCKLYVPKGSYTSYFLASQWGDFTNIIEEETTAIDLTKTNNTKVYKEQDAIVVKDAILGETVSVYTEVGTLLQSTKVTDEVVKINVFANHTYLIKTTNKTFKVAF